MLKFQTKAPMTAFLTLSLKDLLLAIMGRFFLKKKFLKKLICSRSYLLIDPADKKNQKNAKHVDIGFAA